MWLIPTAGPRGDCPQTTALIAGFEGVGHVVADAACDSGHHRTLIECGLGAGTGTRANTSPAIKPPLDPDRCAGRQKVENFFQQIKRFRRIALRCEKTLTSFMGIDALASAPDGLR